MCATRPADMVMFLKDGSRLQLCFFSSLCSALTSTTYPYIWRPVADMVVFLKDGSRLELAGLERFQDIVDYIEAQRRKL